MTDAKKLKLKGMIASASSIEEADAIIEQHTDFKTFTEKRAFLEGMFCYQTVNTDEVLYHHHLRYIFNRFKGL